MFAARMKLPFKTNYKQVVDNILTELKLEKCADTKIGGSTIKGVSGGERKRTSIGIEIITDPLLIFLDEPTTGLDSFTASVVVQVLRDMAKRGRTVIATIHQPNSDTFELFDKLMLLAQGKIIYLNDAQRAAGYFSNIGYVLPSFSNPADYFMRIMSKEAIPLDDKSFKYASKETIDYEYERKINFFVDKYED
jgi:ABC-type multidrug transport system ATPase subunit